MVDRRSITFAQAEGVAPLPSQLALGEVSQQLRALLWAIFHEAIQKNRVVRQNHYRLGDWTYTTLYNYWVLGLSRMSDEFDDRVDSTVSFLKPVFTQGTYVQLLGFVEFTVRQKGVPYFLADTINEALAEARSAYRIVDRDTVVPISSEAEGAAIKAAFDDVSGAGLSGAKAHLRNAASALTEGSWADSVRESVHAVEAVARTLEPSATTLDPALSKLEKAGHIHTSLRLGFGKLYGFTNDEKGIRHALLDKQEAAVDETDALYMFGACAAFVSYLVGKARAAGLL